jgi:hypothetical protein
MCWHFLALRSGYRCPGSWHIITSGIISYLYLYVANHSGAFGLNVNTFTFAKAQYVSFHYFNPALRSASTSLGAALFENLSSEKFGFILNTSSASARASSSLPDQL